MRGPDESPEAPMSLYSAQVLPEWIDYNGHMSEAFYVLVFGYATDALLENIGADRQYRERTGSSVYTLEAHITYLKSAKVGEPLRIETRLLDLDHKRAHIFHAMHQTRRDDLLATEEALLMHVDMLSERSTPFPHQIHSRLEDFRQAHAGLPRPKRAGHSIAISH